MVDDVVSWLQLVEWMARIRCTRLLSGFFFTETQDNWTWFMENLRKAIGDLPLLAVSIDACKGLENAVKAVLPHVEQMECFRHLMDDYVKRYDSVVHMYPAARAYRKVVHEHHKSIVRRNPEVCA
jgi:transposase-like protein